jgi:molecular chaperone HtpG
VGEVHVIDSRIITNGRRDHYEQNVHYTNLINQLSPIAREISTRCRQSSIRRNWLRQFERQRDQVRHDLEIVKQGALTSLQRQVLLTQIHQVLDLMSKALLKDFLKEDAPAMEEMLSKLRRDFLKIKTSGQDAQAKALSGLAPVQRRAYQQVFSLLYECSSDKTGAKLLVDRMLVRIAQENKKKRKK